MRRRGLPVDRAFREELRAFLEPYRLAGYDVAVAAPRYIPLDVRLVVYPRPGRRASLVRAAVLEALGGPAGFFAPDAFGFGQPLHRSRLIACVAAVEGVDRVEVVWFRRAGADHDEEHIALGPLEIARLDVAPGNGSYGSFNLNVEGGL